MSQIPRRPPRPDGQPDEPEDFIGSAHMREDGTLELKLSAEGPGNILGEAMFVVAPTDPRYEGVLSHLRPIAPGGYAPVRPFPPGVF